MVALWTFLTDNLLWIIGSLVVLGLLQVGVLRYMAPRALAPANVGVGVLAPCPPTPNAACSQSPASDMIHYIAPLRYTSSRADAHADLMSAIATLPDYEIITERNAEYIHVLTHSRFIRAIDDNEFVFAAGEPIIHMRAAARLGLGDGGMNLRRLRILTTHFNALQAARAQGGQ
jgi:uncharacterized protein (DUF1499 family)